MKCNKKEKEFNIKEQYEFFNSIATLYESEMPIGDIFKTIMKSTSSKRIQRVCGVVSEGIAKGETIEEAMQGIKSIIGVVNYALVSAGEKSGTLEKILKEISENIKKQEEIKNKLISTLIYPICIFIFAIGIGMFFSFIVMPILRASANYEDVCISSFYFKGGIKIISVYAVISAVVFLIIKEAILQKTFKKIISKLPIINGILKNYYISNFLYVISIGYKAGIDLAKCVELGNRVILQEEVNQKIKNAEIMIERGVPISKALKLTGEFTENAISQIRIGEEAGKIEKMSKIAAREYENEMNGKIDVILKVIGPVLLVIVGTMIGIISVKAYSEYFNAIFSIL